MTPLIIMSCQEFCIKLLHTLLSSSLDRDISLTLHRRMKRAKKSIIIIGRFELIFDSRIPLRPDDINVLFCVSILLNK
jgi:hypothetical protein